MPIQVLTARVAATIAAGEVVERPASVVKELMENAIDAGARAIRIDVERGGLDLMRVADDGCGIDPIELELACQRHATSKLVATADLASLHTLGFRGEALPSIVAAADVQVSSRTSSTAAGATIRYRAGQLIERAPYGGARGTTISVKNLFAHQPARLKFLRSAAAEAGQIAAALHPYAIAYAEIRFSLTIDGRQVLQTGGNGDLRDAAARVLGADIAGLLLNIAPSPHGDGEICVSGLIGPPSLSRSTRSGITVLINRRWVQPRRLTVAIEQAYSTLLMTGRHPVATVEVRVSPDAVDVNVHPTKAEVRFRDERAVFGAVLAAVRRSLVGQAPVPDFDAGLGLFEGRGAEGRMTEAAAIGQVPWPILSEPQPSQAPLWQSLLHPHEHDGAIASQRPDADVMRIPLLRVVGQTGGTYVVAEGPTGMYLIDQHAAHERILYEQLSARQAETAVRVQGMLAPVAVELSLEQAATYGAFVDMLTVHGFAVEPFGDRTVLLRTVPAIFAATDLAKAFVALLDALAEERDAPTVDGLIKTLACHGSVRAGKALAIEEMRELIVALEGCESPRTCPHGRPTMVHVSTATLEREFRRR